MSDKFSLKPPQKRWILTFSDLATLLLTFFVMLLSIAQVDIKQFEEVIKSIKIDRGVKSEKILDPALINTSDSTQTVTEEIHQDIKDMLKQLENIIRENDLEGEITMEMSKNGIRVRVKGKLLFDSGEADIRKSATRLINGLAAALNRHNFYLVVEGHTDSVPIKTSKYASNWELSSARATSVIRYLINYGIGADRLSAIGYSQNYPLDSNKTEDGRSKNRRVEFIFTKYPTRVVI